MSNEPTSSWQGSLDPHRVANHKRLMRAQERIARARYARGVNHETVLAALEAAETGLSSFEEEQDLYLAVLNRYVAALGGRLELRAIFGEETIGLGPEPPNSAAQA